MAQATTLVVTRVAIALMMTRVVTSPMGTRAPLTSPSPTASPRAPTEGNLTVTALSPGDRTPVLAGLGCLLIRCWTRLSRRDWSRR